MTAAETDASQGGLYSLWSYSLHVPLAHLFLQRTNPTALAVVQSKRANVEIVTGIPSLGQGADVQALLRASQSASLINQALSGMSQVFSPERIAELALLAEGFNPDKIERTEEELQEIAASAAPLDPADPENLTSAIEGTIQNV